MNIEQARYLILHNRQYLAGLYEQKALFKKCKSHCDKVGNIVFEYECHNNIKKLSREIAKLVSIQKQLKADIKVALAAERNRVEEMRRAGN